jgi:ribulose-phosphate 3-epimerase
MNSVIPGILEKDWQEIERKLAVIRPFSKVVHIDFLDGKFCEETSLMDFQAFAKYKDDFLMEAHLMTENPTQFIKPLAVVGFKRFLGQVEKMGDVDEFIAEGQIFGEVGLAIDSPTSIDSINVQFDDLDCVLLMGDKAGKSGQVFLPETLEKIKDLRLRTQIPIEIDGGINEQTIVQAKAAGANRFVTTSFVFQSEDPLNSFEKLEGLISS